MQKGQLFYRCYEDDAKVLAMLLGFKLNEQGTTKTCGIPRQNYEKYFTLLKEAWYSFIIIKEIEKTNRKAIFQNKGTKKLSFNIPLEDLKTFHQHLKDIINKYPREQSSKKEIAFEVVSEELQQITNEIQNYNSFFTLIKEKKKGKEETPNLDFSWLKEEFNQSSLEDLEIEFSYEDIGF